MRNKGKHIYRYGFEDAMELIKHGKADLVEILFTDEDIPF
jgi:hypothetical protein